MINPRWSLNGTMIDLRADYRRRLSGGNLVIRNLDLSMDAGIYQCTAFNSLGAILSRRATLQFACELLYYCSSVCADFREAKLFFLALLLLLLLLYCSTVLSFQNFTDLNFKTQTRSAVSVREGQGVVLLCGTPIYAGGKGLCIYDIFIEILL